MVMVCRLWSKVCWFLTANIIIIFQLTNLTYDLSVWSIIQNFLRTFGMRKVKEG